MRLRNIAGIAFVAFILLSTLLPVQALAASGDETTTGAISLEATIKCIGVAVSYSGDNNQNNSAVLQYRSSGGSWKTAPEMYADRNDREYRGSIFWLNADTPYEVRVTFSDTNGVSGTNPVTGTKTTRDDNPVIGTNYLYVATTGSDTSGDGTQGNPWKTIQKAASVVNPGDTVLVRAGTYTVTSSISFSRSGTSSNYITFMPYSGESVTIDGNNTLYDVFVLTGNYIRIKGFNFTNDAYNYEGATLKCDGGDYCIIEDNYFTNPQAISAFMIRSGSSYNIFRNNTVYIDRDSGHAVYWWRGGTGNIIYGNDITGTAPYTMWDGMGGGPENELGYMYNTDIYDNTIIYSEEKTGDWDRDDGIQLEGGAVNGRIWGNYVKDALIGIGACPATKGPIYIFRNTIVGSGMLKLGDGSYGRIYVYHNSFYSDTYGGPQMTNPGLGNVVSRNNIVRAGRYVYEFTSSLVPDDMDFDNDFMYTSDTSRFIEWDGAHYSNIGAFQSATGFELNGVSTPDAGYTDPSGGDLTLQAGSICIDAGVILPGFNDADSPWPYEGNAPDMGAWESGSSGPSNNPPVAVNDSYSTDEDITLNVAAPGVLSNDTDADEDPLTAIKVSNPSHGTVTLNSNGSLVYNPASGYTGTDSFTYQANDGTQNSNTATVTITINGGNTPPVAVNDSYSTSEDTNLNVAAPGVLNNDTDADEDTLTAVQISNPSHGTANLNSDGSFIYNPDSGYTGTDSFTYQAYDGQDNSNIATVTINISGGDNTPPIAEDDYYSINEDNTLVVYAWNGVLNNDTDADEDPLTAVKISDPSHGTVTLNSNGSFVYEPDTNYNGTDSFTYRANDGTDNSNIATVTIDIDPRNDAPVLASIGNKSVTEGETLEFTVSATDPEDDPLTYSARNLPVGASFESTTQVFSWTPDEDQIGAHYGIRFTVRDDHYRYDYERISMIVRAAPENPPGGGGGGGSGGGGSGGGSSGTTSLTNMTTDEGEIVSEVLCTTDDEAVTLILPKDTIVKTQSGGKAGYIRIRETDEQIHAGEYCYGITACYDIQPNGVTFDPSVPLIFKYDPDDLREGMSADSLYIARYDPDTQEWINLGGIVDPETCTVSTQIEHLSLYAVLAETQPASFEVAGFSISPQEIIPGGTITASAVINNRGNYYGTCEVQLILDNTVVQAKTIDLAGGASEAVTFLISSDVTGEHRLSIGDMASMFSVIVPESPASFTVSGLSINPDSVHPGDNVYISALITNNGKATGTYQVALVINDISVQTKVVTLDGGQSTTVSFNVAPDRYGLNHVSIEDLLDSFEVKPVPPPIVAEVANQLEVTNFSTALNYDEATNKLVYAKIVYQMNLPYNAIPDARLILTVLFNDELLEQIPLLTFSQLQPDGKTGQLNYIPSAGWEIGEYSFRVELYDREIFVQDTPLEKVIVTPESITKNVSWWTLGAVIGVAMILIIAFLAVMIYRKRDILEEEQL